MKLYLYTWLKALTCVLFLYFLPGPGNALAQLKAPGFEKDWEKSWSGPLTGGKAGGKGSGGLVTKGSNHWVRAGTHALQLVISDEAGSEESVAWAAIVQKHPVIPDQRVHAGIWLFHSSTHAALSPKGTSVQVLLEYFADENCKQLVTNYVSMAPHMRPSTHPPDTWHLLEMRGRAPRSARALRLSVSLIGYHLGKRPQAVWLDDAFLNLKGVNTFRHVKPFKPSG